jgi:hypothetical protein
MAVPNAPVLSAIVDGVKQLTLTWTKPADGGADIDVYKIYTGTVLVDTVTGSDVLTYVDTGLGDGVTVAYTVKAHNADGDSVASNEESGTTFTAPGAPTALGTIDGDATVSLAWTAPVSTGGTAITSYKLYRGTTTGVLTLVKSVGTTSTTDASLTNGTTYFYAVSAVNAVGEGVKSVETTAKPEATITVLNAFANKNLRACDAVSAQIYNLTGGHSWTFDIPANKKVIGIVGEFASTDNMSGTLSIITNITNKTIKVYDGSSESTNLFDITAVVYYI